MLELEEPPPLPLLPPLFPLPILGSFQLLKKLLSPVEAAAPALLLLPSLAVLSKLMLLGMAPVVAAGAEEEAAALGDLDCCSVVSWCYFTSEVTVRKVHGSAVIW